MLKQELYTEISSWVGIEQEDHPNEIKMVNESQPMRSHIHTHQPASEFVG